MKPRDFHQFSTVIHFDGTESLGRTNHIYRSSPHDFRSLVIPFQLGVCGVTFNSIVVLFLRKAKSLANPFGIITLNQAVTDLINSIVFAFIVAPTVFLTIPLPFEVTSRLGQLLFLAYDCCSWSHLLITLNRFTSIFFPFYYALIFSRSKTLLYTLLIWTLAICINFYEYVFVDCHFYLPVGSWNFDFKGGDACKDIEWNMFLTAVIAILDIATVIKFHRYSRDREQPNSQRKKRMQKQEFYFLAQAMLQSTLFYIELVCCYNLGALPFVASQWAQFGLRTVAWVTTHAADGLITLVCNGDFRRMVSRNILGAKGESVEELHSAKTSVFKVTTKISVEP
ncbi:hypothetical protein PRIPAC_75687 [Pristionchus pacificus]|uniref:G protein-coupled receptor n=1 Tax=Pristionchus pacificus TaxID=54126 RepID=A0A2A6BFW7_PRIPA|nr:hypothetical protein PRIPAC_75687 [Pristionchus pacificus]|eukprot:PDM64777.1 G protein-coupled receptor [Pristionchus pacificus]